MSNNDLPRYARLVLVTRRKPKETHILRKKFKALHILQKLHLDTEKYACHHIIGLSLGGDSRQSNIMIMDRRQHELLHYRYLDPQTKYLRARQSQFILIPTVYDMNSKEFKMYDAIFREKVLPVINGNWRKPNTFDLYFRDKVREL